MILLTVKFISNITCLRLPGELATKGQSHVHYMGVLYSTILCVHGDQLRPIQLTVMTGQPLIILGNDPPIPLCQQKKRCLLAANIAIFLITSNGGGQVGDRY